MGVRGLVEQREYLARTSLLVAVFTLVLTTAFIGIMALLTGEGPGVSDRLPWYVLLAAIVFVGTILILEEARYGGRTVLTAAVTTGVLGFVLILLGGEGLVFAGRNPDDILSGQLLLYFLSAAVIATGLGLWGLRHWREFGGQRREFGNQPPL